MTIPHKFGQVHDGQLLISASRMEEPTLYISGLTIGLILLGPIVYERRLDLVPAAGALRVLQKGVAQVILPLLGGHHGEVPANLGLAGLGVFDCLLNQRIVGFYIIKALEGGGKAHVAAHGFLALFGGYHPSQEFLRRLLIILGGLLVDVSVIF